MKVHTAVSYSLTPMIKTLVHGLLLLLAFETTAVSAQTSVKIYANSEAKKEANSLDNLVQLFEAYKLSKNGYTRADAVFNATSHALHVKSSHIPDYVSSVSNSLELIREESDELVRQIGIAQLQKNLDRVNTDTITVEQIQNIVIKNIDSVPGLSKTAVAQQSWLRILTRELFGLKKAEIELSQTNDDIDSMIIRVNASLNDLDELDKRKAAFKSSTNFIVNQVIDSPQEALRVKTQAMASFIGDYAGYAAKGASIAADLGIESAAKELGSASKLFGIGSRLVAAFTINPMAGLGAVDEILSLFGKKGPEEEPVVDQLEKLSGQISELQGIVSNNHEEAMAKLEFIEFLNNTQLTALSTLLEGGVDHCKNIISFDNRVKQVAGGTRAWDVDMVDVKTAFRHDDLSVLNENFASQGTSWEQCRGSLDLLFGRSLDVADAFSVLFSTENDWGKDSQHLKTSIALFEVIKDSWIPSESRVSINTAPSWIVSEVLSPRRIERDAMLMDYQGEYVFSPTDDQYKLLDPKVVEKYVGYLLAVYPYYYLVDHTNRLLSLEETNDISETDLQPPIRALKKALGIVNLSMRQQLMLSGENLGYKNPNLVHVLANLEKINKAIVDESAGKLELSEVFGRNLSTQALYSTLDGQSDEFELNSALEGGYIPFIAATLDEYQEENKGGDKLGFSFSTDGYGYGNPLHPEQDAEKLSWSLQEFQGVKANVGLDVYLNEPINNYTRIHYTPFVERLERLQNILVTELVKLNPNDPFNKLVHALH